MAEAYPLEWPSGWKRTRTPRSAPFNITPAKALKETLWEIDQLGGAWPVVSTNVPLRQDGMPRASYRGLDDTGVAIYFQHKKAQKVFACDQYDTVGDNIRAIGKTIGAIRGIDRWGASDLLERTLSAFDALPPPSDNNAPLWPIVLGVSPDASEETIEAAFRSKARETHPDTGGTAEAFQAVSAARDAALTARGTSHD